MPVRYLIAFLFFAAAANAQQKVYLAGFVNDINTLQPLSYVNISTGGRVLTATDQNGFFSVVALANDTLVFTRLGYQNYRVVAVENSWDERVFMNEMSRMLDEVTIYDQYQIHGSEEIRKNSYQDTRLNNFTMDPKNQGQMIQTFGPSMSFGAPWNRWSKDVKEKKKLQAVLSEKQRTAVYNDFIHSMAVEEYFMESFGLDEETFLKYKEGFIVASPDARYLRTRRDIVDLMVAYFASRKP